MSNKKQDQGAAESTESTSEAVNLKSDSPQYRNATVPDNLYKPYYEKTGEESDDEPMAMLNIHPHVVRKTFEEVKSSDIPGSPSHVKDYTLSVNDAMTTSGRTNEVITPFRGDDRDWHNEVEYEGYRIRPTRPKPSLSNSASIDQIILRTRAAAKLGTVISAPMPHTGIWLDIKAPSEAELLTLERRIMQDKISLGRFTSGLTFSNVSVYLNMNIINSALSNVYNTTYNSLNVADLKKVLLITDMPAITWAYCNTIWPDGYRISRPCVADPNKCTHVDEKIINLGKIFWIDRRAVSDKQKRILANKTANLTDENLLEYRNSSVRPSSRQIKVSDDMAVELAVPTIAEYEEAGHRWIDGIKDSIDTAFGESISSSERDQYITQHGTTTKLRRYAHWIKRITFDDVKTYDDRDMIDVSLDNLSGNPEIANMLFKEIEKFMSDVVVAAVGIPAYTCPKCNGEPVDLVPGMNDLIQLEINEIFFILERTRIARLMKTDQ